MKILVQKFGGTSVSTESIRESAADHIEHALKEGYRVVVVVSAMGRKGEPYATDQLLDLVAGQQHPAKRELDILLSCGETISAVVFASMLRNRGIDATALTGAQAGIITDHTHGEARILRVQTDRLLHELESGRVAVVTGFQGSTETGEITTLGRGGSDTTAAALGAALNAERIDIFTDVEGILTADPRIVSNARLLSELSYTDARHLAWEGAKVIHPRAVDIAMRRNIPLHVRATKTTAEGSRITYGKWSVEDNQYPMGHIVGVAHRTNLVQYTVEANTDKQQQFFAAIREAGVSSEVATTFPDGICLTIAQDFSDELERYTDEQGMRILTETSCARVSLVGNNLEESQGLMSNVFQTLVNHQIDVLQSADAPFSLRVVVPSSNLTDAVTLLHDHVSQPSPLSSLDARRAAANFLDVKGADAAARDSVESNQVNSTAVHKVLA